MSLQQQQTPDDFTNHVLFTEGGTEKLGFVGKNIEYGDQSLQLELELWLGIQHLNQVMFSNARGKNDNQEIHTPLLVQAMSQISHSVPLFYYLLQCNPAICGRK